MMVSEIYICITISYKLIRKWFGNEMQSVEASVRLGHKTLRTLMKRSSLW